MYYALVVDGTIQATYQGLPPNGRRLDTGEWIEATGGVWDPENLAACGYVEVVDTPRPVDTATETYDFTIQMVVPAGGGAAVPTVVWVLRTKTQAEIDAANTAQLLADIKSEITTLIALRASLKTNILDIASATVNASPASYLKEAVRGLRDTDRALIRMGRIVANQVSSMDTGAA